MKNLHRTQMRQIFLVPSDRYNSTNSVLDIKVDCQPVSQPILWGFLVDLEST